MRPDESTHPVPAISLVIDNIDTKIAGALSDAILDKISDALSYKTSIYNGAKFIEVENKMFLRKPRTFPTGLCSNVAKIFDDNGVDFDIIDRRKITHRKEPITLLANLRDYQQTIVDEAIKNQRFIVQVATGGGKTVIASGIIARLNVKTLFMVHTGDLFKQAHDELSKFLGVPIGRIGGGYCEIRDINVCMIQTLHAVMGKEYVPFDEIEKDSPYDTSEDDSSKFNQIRMLLEQAECVLVDECHHISSDSYVNIMRACRNSFYKGGLSATPLRGDGRDMVLKAYAGSMIGKISASYLISKGWLIKPKIYYLQGTSNSKYKLEKKKYNGIYKKYITESVYRNTKIVDCTVRLTEMKMKVLITVATKKHGFHLLRMIQERLPDVKSEFIHGSVKRDERSSFLDRMRAGDLDVLIGTSLADEGLDIPILNALILAGGGKSATRMIQRVGRVLRKDPKGLKTEAIVIDFKDNVRYLLGHYKQRREILESEPEFEIIEAYDA